MDNLNLVLNFRMAGEKESSVRGAARIKLDGHGVTVYDPETASAEKIQLDDVQSLSIRFLGSARKAA
jgi:outer membrane lipoprotein-sorting protein